MVGTDLVTMQFDPSHREDIVNGSKRSTLRYQPSELPTIGEPFILEEAKSLDYLGTAICIERGYESVDWIVKDPIYGHRPYESVESCIDHLQGYYPKEEFSADTCLEIVYWGDLIGRKIDFDLRRNIRSVEPVTDRPDGGEG